MSPPSATIAAASSQNGPAPLRNSGSTSHHLSAMRLILISRIADKWWLVLPEFRKGAGPFWLDAAAIVALGGLMVLLFAWAMRYAHRLARRAVPVLETQHG